MNTAEKQKLVLGAAGKDNLDSITLDIDPKHNPDVIHDLNKLPWPFEDNQFKHIRCHHVLEHLDNIAPVMEELHRICSDNGEIYIEVPHYASVYANSPEHKLRFGHLAFDGYIVDGKTEWITTDNKFKLLERKVTFHKHYRRYFLQKIFNLNLLWYERFWVYIFPPEQIIFRLQPIKK